MILYLMIEELNTCFHVNLLIIEYNLQKFPIQR